MAKNGTLITVAEDQEGASPKIVTPDNPFPISAPNGIDINQIPLTYETDTAILLNEISRKLSILIKYEAMFHKIDLEEDK